MLAPIRMNHARTGRESEVPARLAGLRRAGLALAFGAALLGLGACGHGGAGAAAPERARRTQGSYLERRAVHRTHLRRLAPLSERWPTEAPPAPARRVTFRSGALELFGWLAMPEGEAASVPALVYLHGGPWLDRRELERCRPFLEAGFAVLTPTLRGRNGNPGSHELVYGEVDDARAAVEWLAAQPGIDRARIYAFGHSMGGATAAMLSLYPDLPVALTGSSGGIYSTETFRRWARGDDQDLIRFDPQDPDEVELRVLLPHAAELAHDHVAYFGSQERSIRANAAAVAARARGARFEVVEVPGDHMSALTPALTAFLQRVR